jgi:beta-hydroxylase
MASKIAGKWFKNSGIAILRTFDFLVQTFAIRREIWENDAFPFNQILRENRALFLHEYDQMYAKKEIQYVKDFFKVETDIKADENWKAAPIILFNYLFKENAKRCPETFKIISRLPGCCGAMFSVLEPGKYIPPHRGIYKGAYRCLLTLRVQPNAECWIKVNNQKLYFKEGDCIVFDETIEHEVLNESTSPRIVLFLDFYRKLPFPLNIMNYLIFELLRRSPFVTNILKEHAKLEKTTFEKFVPLKSTLT